MFDADLAPTTSGAGVHRCSFLLIEAFAPAGRAEVKARRFRAAVPRRGTGWKPVPLLFSA